MVAHFVILNIYIECVFNLILFFKFFMVIKKTIQKEFFFQYDNYSKCKFLLKFILKLFFKLI